jgi:hypothetical protein
MRWITDDQGQRWSAERTGRTSGMVPTRGRPGSFPEPQDIIRFECESHRTEPDREITTRAGLLDQASDADLRTLLNAAPRATT